ncbi:MAG: AbrB/MazE/SpoVT family DNA-binding domain-containing protein [Clostridiales bacterium]|nr:AbrB/MazE/SpoVT family DNA-binding domain-containing protein [Clostridiales bacterium]
MKSINKDKCLWTAKVGEKGQIVIPKEARDMFNIHTGDSLILFGDINRGIAIAKYDDYADAVQQIFNVSDGQK